MSVCSTTGSAWFVSVPTRSRPGRRGSSASVTACTASTGRDGRGSSAPRRPVASRSAGDPARVRRARGYRCSCAPDLAPWTRSCSSTCRAAARASSPSTSGLVRLRPTVGWAHSRARSPRVPRSTWFPDQPSSSPSSSIRSPESSVWHQVMRSSSTRGRRSSSDPPSGRPTSGRTPDCWPRPMDG